MGALDIPEPQVLRHFPNDENGLTWHHRVLLKKIGQGRWVAASPDLDLELIDLTEVRHYVLERKGLFPEDRRKQVYAFDEVDRVTLNALKRRAALQSALLDDASQEDARAESWLIAEAGHPRFGNEVDADLLEDAPLGVTKGVVTLDGAEVFVEKVDASDIVTWKKAREASEGDLRLLGVHRSSCGDRFLSFRDAVALLKETPLSDWKSKGPRAFREFCMAVRDGPGDLTSYHAEWERRSGVGNNTSVCHIHFVLCEVVRLLLCVDQCDGSNMQAAELVVRRIIQDEAAVARNPRHPDYGGLQLIMDSPISEQGHAQVAKFTEWMISQLRDQAGIFKQSRLWNEEQRLRGKGKGERQGRPRRGRQWRRRGRQRQVEEEAGR